MELGIIVATSENGVIGNKGKMPWYIPEDLKHFRELTLNHPIIMGRKTYESIGKPLPKRDNIILSRNNLEYDKTKIAHSIDEVFAYLHKEENPSIDYKKVYVIGGQEIYEQFLPLVNFIELTKIHEFYDGDSYFKFNEKEWKEKNRTAMDGFDFISYIKNVDKNL